MNNYLFNFAASYLGGGYKRLYEYSKWFNKNGGACFIIHPRCAGLINQFQNNRFFPVTQSSYQRILNDCGFLDSIKKEIGKPDLYYSYGIPIYSRVGEINWFHLSNVLALPPARRNIPISPFDRIKFSYLGWRIRRNYINADVISAESNYSLNLIDSTQTDKLRLSVNGSDDELAFLHSKASLKKENIATVLGTVKYKALSDSYLVLEMLRQKNNQLKLMIIGNEKAIPKNLCNNSNVIITGLLDRSSVIDHLQKTMFYISTTYVENSYNAASEGIFFADESYISDIGPHRELLIDIPFEQVEIPGMNRPMLHIRRENISGRNLQTWENVIRDLIDVTSIKTHNLRKA